MSVLIKGMRMPENCIKCPMQFGGMCYVMPAEVDESRVAPTVEEALKQGKPDWCPLIEVKEPHGRLIDADRVTAESIKGTGKRLLAIDTAPTVIEAEGSEEE